VKIYDSETYKPLGEAKVSIDADSIAYDAATSNLYVVSGGREAHTPYSLISVIDTNNTRKLRDIKIPSDHVEAITLEKSGPRMFINITGQNAVGVMDRNKSELSAKWPLPAGDKLNVAMAFDEANHRLFVVTRNPGKLIVMNSDDGKVIADLPAVGMVDDAAYDAQHKRIYLAGDQFLDVLNRRMRITTLCSPGFPVRFGPRPEFWCPNSIATIWPSRIMRVRKPKFACMTFNHKSSELPVNHATA